MTFPIRRVVTYSFALLVVIGVDVSAYSLDRRPIELPSVIDVPESELPSRRSFLSISSSVLISSTVPGSVYGIEDGGRAGGKPYAPIEALLPATRCKLWIDRAYGISSQLAVYVENNDDSTESSAAARKISLLTELDRILSAQPEFFRKNEQQKKANPLGAAAGQLTGSISKANKNQYKQNRQNLSIPNQLEAIFNQADVERQWGMLQYAEANREKNSPIRAALNCYTQQLVFDGESYLLTASEKEKKAMIRSDRGLPTLTTVVASDLDLRDLYRNQLLTAIDDAKAEVSYQVKQIGTGESIDLTDTITLMQQAHTACNNWFGLISRDDVEEALGVISEDDR